MPRFRNPRYAPEFLERRLHPSSIAGVVPAAEVATSDTAPDPRPTPRPRPIPQPEYPPTDPSLPPLGDPLPPVGPALPG